MAAKQRLAHLVSGFAILDEERVQIFTTNLLLNLSIGATKGTWSSEQFPEEFAEAKRLLTENKAWYLRQQAFMNSVRSIRESYPRTHWWWWIEELS